MFITIIKMKKFFTKLRFAPLSVLLLLGACAGGENTNQNVNQAGNNGSNTVVTAKDDAAELGKIIKLPLMPEEVSFREESLTDAENKNRQPSPNEKKLIAVLKFTAEDAQKIVEQAEKYKPAEFVSIDTESWFPAELIAQSQPAGDLTLKGNSYAANDFYQTPYMSGRITRISETHYFVLELFSM